jgi:hypothetical protein
MPSVKQIAEGVIQADQEHLGRYYLHANSSPAPVSQAQATTDQDDPLFTDEVVIPELIFTENDTNFERLYGGTNTSLYVKDGFHDHIIPGHRPKPTPVVIAKEKTNGHSVGEAGYDSDTTADGATTPTEAGDATPIPSRDYVNPEKRGTKAGAHYIFRDVPADGGCAVVRLKLTTKTAEEDASVQDEESFDCVIEERRMDSDEFYSRFNSGALSDDLRNIMRQALSGMLWYVHLPSITRSDQSLMRMGFAGTSSSSCSSRRSGSKETQVSPRPLPSASSSGTWSVLLFLSRELPLTSMPPQDWSHLHIEDVLSMPDGYDYPFWATWDTVRLPV